MINVSRIECLSMYKIWPAKLNNTKYLTCPDLVYRSISVSFTKLTMAQCQDRAFRRMSELREQIHLDQLAKRDLEENYRLLLDEKDEYMKVLQMQVWMCVLCKKRDIDVVSSLTFVHQWV